VTAQLQLINIIIIIIIIIIINPAIELNSITANPTIPAHFLVTTYLLDAIIVGRIGHIFYLNRSINSKRAIFGL
jgi:hypothetical protein